MSLMCSFGCPVASQFRCHDRCIGTLGCIATVYVGFGMRSTAPPFFLQYQGWYT